MYIKNRGELPRGDPYDVILDALEAALDAADPYKAVASALAREGGEFKKFAGVHVVGFGKASVKMAKAAVDALGGLVRGGVVISPEGEGSVGPVRVLKGDHPVPGRNTLKSSQELLEYLEEVGEGDALLVLVSGGGSALFEAPEEGVSLEEVGRISLQLMKRGADIVELNAVRKRLSRVKGGKLLKMVKARYVLSLVISDVVGDRLDTIASGPTAPDYTTTDYAVAVLKKYKMWDELPPHVKEAVLRGDTLKPGDPHFNKVKNVVVASNLQSLRRAEEVLRSRYNTLLLTAMLEGEAREAGRVLASVAKGVAHHSTPVPRPAAILAGGETVVTVRGSGVGGRNQELCLSFAVAVKGYDIYAACLGTDGVDGNSPAAGAIVDGAMASAADPLPYLENNDSYTFFKALNRAIYTGYTGTNVNDVFIAVVK
ncbi:MAG: glycerate kinase [Pyrobaculum sp.]